MIRHACTMAVTTDAADEYRWIERTADWIGWWAIRVTDSYAASLPNPKNKLM